MAAASIPANAKKRRKFIRIIFSKKQRKVVAGECGVLNYAKPTIAQWRFEPQAGIKEKR
jgi:hypothetical protein